MSVHQAVITCPPSRAQGSLRRGGRGGRELGRHECLWNDKFTKLPTSPYTDQDRIIELRGQKVLLDADVAQIYGVETRDINKAVSNNSDKFPAGYVVELSKAEKNELVENFHRFNRLKHSTVNPKAFPEKGLYMLATILKSPHAVQATLAIIETFSKMRKLTRNIKTLSNVKDKREQQALMQKSGEIIVEILDDDLQTTDTETSIELNFAVLKFKHTIKKKNK